MFKGLILGIISNLFMVKNLENEEIYECTSRGKFKLDQEVFPVVGDNVLVEESADEKTGVITKIVDRKTYIKRPKIANLNHLICVVSNDSPKPDLLMLDKQLAYSEFMNIDVTICINKIDIGNYESIKDIKEIYENIGYKVILLNADKNIGIEDIKEDLKDKISAFAGNSGVGKSTIVNALFNESIALEGSISLKNKKGKNTTTSIMIYELEKNTYIADTPGFSTFTIEEIETEDLGRYFREFNNFLSDCEFLNCTHIKEDKCGIKNALEENKIFKDRYNRYIRIYEELNKQSKFKKYGGNK